MIPADTSPEAYAVQLAVIASKTPAERLRLVVRSSRIVRDLALAGLRHQRPDLAERELRKELLRRLHPDIPLPRL